MHGVVELPRTGQVDAERLLHHHPRVLRPAGRSDPLRDPPEQLSRHLHVVQDLLARADLIRHRLIGRFVAEVPVHVPQQAEHLLRRRAVRVHVVELQRGGGVVAELLQPPAALRHPDHRDVQHSALDQAHQRRERLDLSQVPGGTEDYQRVNFVRHVIPPEQSLRSHRARAPLASPALGDPWPAVSSAAQPSRSRIWSPTRTALAIAVRAGFTALMLGKKLVSTT